MSLLPRLLAGARRGHSLTHAEHLHVHGPLPAPGPDLIAEVARAGLRGRGGGGFPTARKLEGVAARRGPRTVLVNAAEGEPLSAKDRALLTLAPHLVLDGALAAAGAVGARRIVVAVRADASRAVRAVEAAAGERADLRGVEVACVPPAYLAGEESALIRHLDGGPLKPRVTPPLPVDRGLAGRPTLVQNAETLAHLALVARHGAGWFRQAGTAEHPGTVLVTVTGAVARPGIQELSPGIALPDVLTAAGGGTEPLRAVLVGGVHGVWIDAAHAPRLQLDDASLARHGARLGAGTIVALGTSACPVRELAATAGWLAGQAAGQCGPCTHGLPALAGLLDDIAAGRAPRDAHARLERWTAHVAGRGACHLPDGAAGLLHSGARVFAHELAAHRRHGPCDACSRPPVVIRDEEAGRWAA